MGGWIASYVYIFIFWSRCCCCCCVLLLLPTTSVLKRREVPAATTAVSFASILLLLLLLRRDMHFCFLVEVLLLLIIFLVGCAAAAAGACAAYNICTEAERGTAYCFFLLRFCPLHCDASDVYCCCCSRLLLFLSFRLRCFDGLEKYKGCTPVASATTKTGYIRTWYAYNIFFFILRLMRYTDVRFFSLSGVLFPRE